MDTMDGVIYRVPPKRDLESFTAATILAPSLPVMMWKATGPGRDKRPRRALFLRSHHQAKSYSGPPRGDHECVLCTAAQRHDLAQVCDANMGAEGASHFICSGCASVWHAACATHMAEANEISFCPYQCPVCVRAFAPMARASDQCPPAFISTFALKVCQ